jgi:hypothetical protein
VKAADQLRRELDARGGALRFAAEAGGILEEDLVVPGVEVDRATLAVLVADGQLVEEQDAFGKVWSVTERGRKALALMRGRNG